MRSALRTAHVGTAAALLRLVAAGGAGLNRPRLFPPQEARVPRPLARVLRVRRRAALGAEAVPARPARCLHVHSRAADAEAAWGGGGEEGQIGGAQAGRAVAVGLGTVAQLRVDRHLRVLDQPQVFGPALVCEVLEGTWKRQQR